MGLIGAGIVKLKTQDHQTAASCRVRSAEFIALDKEREQRPMWTLPEYLEEVERARNTGQRDQSNAR